VFTLLKDKHTKSFEINQFFCNLICKKMMITDILQIFDPLKDNVNTVPALPGNYIFVLRKNRKLPNVGIPVTYTKFREYEVIYVGLASGSLKDRDVKKHFNGNAGGSTLRKSLGCLFGYNLIPRDSNYNSNGKNNVVNLEFRKHLTKLRNNKPVLPYDNIGKIMNQRNSGKELYVQVWQDYLSKILLAINSTNKTVKLNHSLFEAVGNRNRSGYSFRLDIDNGIVPRKKGSDVARDLKKVLDESSVFKHLANGKNIIIRLNGSFELTVQVIR